MGDIETVNLREQYNALRKENRTPPEVHIPEVIALPQVYRDYRLLSDLLANAFEHARLIGLFIHSYTSDDYGRYKEPSIEHISSVCRSLIGLRLIKNTLQCCLKRGDFRLFDLVATETPSVHVHLLKQVTEQSDAAEWFFPFELSPTGAGEVSPKGFTTRCRKYQLDGIWWLPGKSSEHLEHAQLAAELVRVEQYLKDNTSNPPIAADYLSLKVDRDRRIVTRAGETAVVSDIASTDWSLFIAMFDAGEGGLTKIESEKAFTGESSGLRMAKARIKDRLTPLAITIRDREYRLVDDGT